MDILPNHNKFGKQTMLQAAEQYIAQGISVIPLDNKDTGEIGKRGKAPALDTYKELFDRLPTTEEVKDWFQTEGEHNLGVITGPISGITVVDIDIDAGANYKPYADILTKRVKTGKGYHLYFKYTPELPQCQKDGTHIDVRNKHGYVVAAPSTHEKGTQYTVDLDLPLLDVPTWIIDEKKRIREKKAKTPKELMLEGVTKGEGGRVPAAWEIIGKLIKYLPPEDWESFGYTYLEGWNERNKPPLDAWELRKAFDGLCKKESAKNPQIEQPALNFLTIKQLLAMETAKTDWLWEGYISRGEITLLSALPKAGKSTMIGSLISAMQNEEDFLGLKTKKCTITIVSEESESLLKNRMILNGIQEGVYFLARAPQQTFKQWNNTIDSIIAHCKATDTQLLIIDTLSNFWAVDDENDAAKVRLNLSGFQRIAAENIAVLLVHHLRKSGGEQGRAHRGSGALTALPSINIELTRPEGDPLTNKRILTGQGRYDETPRELVIDYIDKKYHVLGDRLQAAAIVKNEEIIRLLEEKQPLAIKEIQENWTFREKAPSTRTIIRRVEGLMIEGKICEAEKKEGKGGAKSYQLTPKDIVRESKTESIFADIEKPPFSSK